MSIPIRLCVLLVCLASTIRIQAQPADVETEQGVRWRLFYVGEAISQEAPLRPGQSPNVDVTIPGLALDGTESCFTDSRGEHYDRSYIAELTGWMRIGTPGRHHFQISSGSPTLMVVDGRRVDGQAIELETGWHRFSITQRVRRADARSLHVRTRGPGERVPMGIEPADLRAASFYFRPTQAGLKELVRGGDRPGLGEKLAGVHPGYRVTNIRPEGMEMPVGALGMLEDGRLVVARFDATTLVAPHPTTEPNGQLWLLEHPDADDPRDVEGEMIADGLFEPCGVHVLDGDIYVSQRHEITRYSFDEDSGTWSSNVVATGWKTNDFHQISSGLPHVPGPTPDHPGFFYMSRGAGLGLMRNPPNHGSVWKIDLSRPAGENVTVLTGGHRTPNGLGLNAEGELFVIDNQGEWTPANELNHVQAGHFYGFYHPHDPPDAWATPFQPDDIATGVVTEAAVRLPQDEIGNSPTQPLLFPESHRFAGHLALPDMRYGGINRVFLEEVGGVWQGCVMRFTQGLEAGPNRIFWGPDDSLYVGGIGGRHASTWYWVDPEGEPTYQGLERLTPTGEAAFEIHDMRATPDGFVVTFTEAVHADALGDPDAYELSQWTYKATRAYGGPKIDLHDLRVESATPSDDGRSVTLTIPDLKAGYVVHLRTDPISVTGRAIWSGEAWYTLNEIPGK